MKYLGVIIFSLLVGGTSCKKDPKPEITIQDEMRAYFASYNQGSWWVYKEQGTGEIDSTFISQVLNIKGTEGEDVNRQVIRVFYDCNKTEDYETYISAQSETESRFKIQYKTGGSHSITMENGNFKIYPGYDSFVIVLDTFSVSGTTYHDVLRIYDDASLYYEAIYFAKGIGIIRKEIPRDVFGKKKIYNLVKCDIKK